MTGVRRVRLQDILHNPDIYICVCTCVEEVDDEGNPSDGILGEFSEVISENGGHARAGVEYIARFVAHSSLVTKPGKCISVYVCK